MAMDYPLKSEDLLKVYTENNLPWLPQANQIAKDILEKTINDPECKDNGMVRDVNYSALNNLQYLYPDYIFQYEPDGYITYSILQSYIRNK